MYGYDNERYGYSFFDIFGLIRSKSLYINNIIYISGGTLVGKPKYLPYVKYAQDYVKTCARYKALTIENNRREYMEKVIESNDSIIHKALSDKTCK